MVLWKKGGSDPMREMKQHQEEYRMKNSNKKEVETFQAYTNTYEKSGCEWCT